MDKTKVDDMQMITPKVKEIEEKFGNGKMCNTDFSRFII
jgi:hypothetical protein